MKFMGNLFRNTKHLGNSLKNTRAGMTPDVQDYLNAGSARLDLINKIPNTSANIKALETAQMGSTYGSKQQQAAREALRYLK